MLDDGRPVCMPADKAEIETLRSALAHVMAQRDRFRDALQKWYPVDVIRQGELEYTHCRACNCRVPLGCAAHFEDCAWEEAQRDS